MKTLLALGACELLKKDYQKSEQYFESIIEEQPKKVNPLLWFAIGLKYQRMQKYKNAIDSFKISITQNLVLKKKTFLIHIKFIECYISLRNYNEAILHYTLHSTEIPPENQPKVLCSIGYCHEQLNNIEKAIDVYQLLSLYPSPLAEIGEIWGQILQLNFNNLQNRITTLCEKYEENTQEWYDCNYILSQFYIASNQSEEAFKLLQDIAKRGSHQEIMLTLLGSLWMKLKNYSEAFICYLRAASLNQNIPEVWFNLAVIYLNAGQNECEAALERAKHLDTGNLLPEKIDENAKIIALRFNLSEFGQNKQDIVIETKPIKPETKIIRQNPEVIKKKFEIVKPTPVKMTSVPLEIKNEELPLQFNSQNMMMLQSCFHFFNRMNEHMNKNEDTQAAQILAKIGSLPYKRNRDQ